MMHTPFAQTNPPPLQIKSAYYKRSLRFHPDHNPDCNHAAEQYRAVTTAYEVLSQVRHLPSSLQTRHEKNQRTPQL